MARNTRSSQNKPVVIFWFRYDLRLHDQLALEHAMERAKTLDGWLLPIYVHDERLHATTPWGFKRTSAKREAWIQMALQDLSTNLTALDSSLIQTEGDPVQLLSYLAKILESPLLVCEEILAPEEQTQIEALRSKGVTVETVWQSTLIAPEALPFPPIEVPDRFTSFRQIIESKAVRATSTLGQIKAIPPLPTNNVLEMCRKILPFSESLGDSISINIDQRSSFPFNRPSFHGGEKAALAHLEQYCRRGLPHSYKLTRNGLLGFDYSTKWSPWLATGALSARAAWAAISDFELSNGANESTYWLGFELLWRDHFRWLHKKYGRRLYEAGGLTKLPPSPHNKTTFQKWCHAETGNSFIDAGMRELASTGYISNRMRQNVASYLIHDLACDWRAGAAWFEACLLDYDVYNNQGNWLYISGRGTDPKTNRRFNTQLQANIYDQDGSYRRIWSEA